MCVVGAASGASTCDPVPQALSSGGLRLRCQAPLCSDHPGLGLGTEAEQPEGGSTGPWERGRPQRRGTCGVGGKETETERERELQSTSSRGHWAPGKRQRPGRDREGATSRDPAPVRTASQGLHGRRAEWGHVGPGGWGIWRVPNRSQRAGSRAGLPASCPPPQARPSSTGHARHPGSPGSSPRPAWPPTPLALRSPRGETSTSPRAGRRMGYLSLPF